MPHHRYLSQNPKVKIPIPSNLEILGKQEPTLSIIQSEYRWTFHEPPLRYNLYTKEWRGGKRKTREERREGWLKKKKEGNGESEREKENVKREKHETRISLSITYALNPGIYTSGINALGLPPSASFRLHWYCVSWTEASTQVLSRYSVIVRVSMDLCIDNSTNHSKRNDLCASFELWIAILKNVRVSDIWI